MPTSTTRSAVNIVIKPRSLDRALPLQARLAALLTTCGKNKHDRALVFITAAIDEGVNTGAAIVGLGGELGLNKQHVGLILKNNEGGDPDRHRWRRDERGVYSLLE